MPFEELDRIDREWEKESERCMVKTKNGRRYVPSASAAVVIGFLAVVMGLTWIVIVCGPAKELGVLKGLLPPLCFVFTFLGMTVSINQFRRAMRYRAAFRHYQRRRAEAEDRLKE
ncbi:MAG TPA: hypothetical protein DDY78_16380 [Planctomycetales bacterium]|jgi:hypothetical protein|nr:hypothetical protein [Planctomycetales bacterium]